MALFWILATLMTLVALAFVVVPLLRARTPAGPSRLQANLEVLQGQRREIEADLANGTLPADAREEALAELVGRAEADLSAAAPAPAAHPRAWVTAGIVALVLPGLAFGIYLVTGTPTATEARATDPAQASRYSEQQIVAMVDNLARKVRERPDDAKGWALLARSTAALGRFKESAEAYERLAALVPGDAQILTDYADSLGMAQGKTLTGRPYELIQEALAIDAQHPKALALAGTAAMDARDYATAARYWQRLASVLPPGSEDERQVQTLLADIRAQAAASRKALPAPLAVAKSPAPIAAANAASAKSVSGLVSIVPEVAAKIGPSDTLFVFARAESGPRMPLAVLRGSARELPLAFALDDTMAMTRNLKLSGAGAVRIEARISRSGNATPQSGDLVGTSGVVKPGARGVKVVVDRVLP